MWLEHQMNGGQVIIIGCSICFRFFLFTTPIESISCWFGWVSKCRLICSVEDISDQSTCIAWRRCCGIRSGDISSCHSLISLAIGCNFIEEKKSNVFKITLLHRETQMIFMNKNKENRTINNPTVSHSALIRNHRSNRPVTHFTFSLAFAELDFRVKYYYSRWLFITVTIFLSRCSVGAIIVKFIAPQCEFY